MEMTIGILAFVAVASACYVAISGATIAKEQQIHSRRIFEEELKEADKRRELIQDYWKTQNEIFKLHNLTIDEQLKEIPRRVEGAISQAVTEYLQPYRDAAEELQRDQIITGKDLIPNNPIDVPESMDMEEEFRRWEAGLT